MELLIREIRPEDAKGIINILNPIIKAGKYTVLDAPLTVEEERKFIMSFPTRGVFHVAERVENGKIVGFQVLEPFAHSHMFDHVATIGTYVDLSLRHQGIGKQLSVATFEAASRKGFEKIVTYVRAGNVEALAFYRGLGFQVVGTTHKQVKFDGKYENEIFVEKFLGI